MPTGGYSIAVGGFEGGSAVGWAGAPTVGTARKRTGTYGARILVAASSQGAVMTGDPDMGGFSAGTPNVTPGDAFASFAQYFVWIDSLPSVNNTTMFGMGTHARVQVNTDGTWRVVYSGLGTTTGGSALPTGRWLRVRSYFWSGSASAFGVGHENYLAAPNFWPASQFHTIAIDDVDTDPTSPVSYGILSGPGGANLGVNALHGPQIGCVPADTGTYDATFDDVVWLAAWGTGIATLAALKPEFDGAVFAAAGDVVQLGRGGVLGLLVTGQGASNDFTTAGDYGAVDEVPRNFGGGSDSVAAGVIGNKTTYTKTPLPSASHKVEAGTVRANLLGTGSVSQRLLFDGVATPRDISVSTGLDDQNTPFASVLYDTLLGPAAFDPKEYGVEVLNTATLTLHNIFMEVLAGIPFQVVNFQSSGGVQVGGVSPETFGLTDGGTFLIWNELTDRSDNVHVSAKVALADPPGYYHGFKEELVKMWGSITRGLSDRKGVMEATEASWIRSDTDRLYRGLLSGTRANVMDRPVTLRVISDIGRRLLRKPTTVMKGKVRKYRPLANLLFEFTAQDQLSYMGTVGNPVLIPKRTVNSTDFANAGSTFTDVDGKVVNIAALDIPVPIVYGEISDTRTTSSTIVDTNRLVLDPTLIDAGTDIPANANGILGASTFAVNQGIRYALTVVKAGLEGPFSRIIGTMNMSFPADAHTALSFEKWDDADSYRIYCFDGWFNPNTGESVGNTFVRFKTHDNATVDGFFGHQFGTEFFGPADGTDFFAAGSTTTVTTDSGVGQCPYVYVGVRNIAGTDYHGFLIAGHACKSIDEIYSENKAVGIATLANRDGWLIPGYDGNPKYEDINGRRYSIVYGRTGMTAADKGAGLSHKADSSAIALAFSVQGIETVGDGSGTLITNLFDQYYHILLNWVFGDYQSGVWLTRPFFDDDPTIPIIDYASFLKARAMAGARVTGGYRGDFIIGWSDWRQGSRSGAERLEPKELIARLNVSADVNSGFNRKTQFMVSMEPQDWEAADEELTDVNDVVKGSMIINDRPSENFTVIPYLHTQDYFNRNAKGWKFEGEKSDAVGISDYGRKPDDPVQLYMVRGQNDTALDIADYAQGTLTGDDVATRRLHRYVQPPRYVTIKVPVGVGATIDLGHMIRLTHFDGIGPEGWQSHPFRVVAHELDPEEASVTLTLFDIGSLLGDSWIWGDDNELPDDWADANVEERLYGYLCDETTDTFSDGAPGKRLS